MAQAPNPFEQQRPIPGVRRIVVVGAGKGGVGKSTVTVNLAMALSKTGAKVGLLDSDIYGPSLPRLMGCLNQKPTINESQMIEPIVRYGVKLMSVGFLMPESRSLVWRGPMLFKMMEQFFRGVVWGELDYLLIDLPPGTGDVPLSVAQKVPVAGAIAVCTPQNLALMDVERAVNMFETLAIPVFGMVENMSYMMAPGSGERVQLFPKGTLDTYLNEHKIEKLAELPFYPNVAMASEMGIPIVESKPESEEALAFMNLAKRLRARCE